MFQMSTLETSEGATIPTVLVENLPELPFVDYCPPRSSKSGSATFATTVAVNIAAAVVVGLFAIAVTTGTSRP